MKGLQDVVNDERKDWGEQLALLKETVRALEDLESTRSRMQELISQVDELKGQIEALRDEASTRAAAKSADAEKSKKRLGGIFAVAKEARDNSGRAALLSLVCAVFLVVSLAVSCWTWHRVNESTGNLYNLIQHQK